MASVLCQHGTAEGGIAKIALVVRDDLPTWRKINVAAFLMSGIIGDADDLLGEPYVDASGNVYSRLCRQPVIVLAADGGTLSEILKRALDLGVRLSIYIEEMFATSNDADNRAVLSKVDPDNANIVGLALRDKRKIVDRIVKGASKHP